MIFLPPHIIIQRVFFGKGKLAWRAERLRMKGLAGISQWMKAGQERHQRKPGVKIGEGREKIKAFSFNMVYGNPGRSIGGQVSGAYGL